MRHLISANDSVPHRCQGIARTADDPVTQHHTVSVLIQRHDLTNKMISIIKIRRPYDNLIIIKEMFSSTNMVIKTQLGPTRSGWDIHYQGFLAPVKYCYWYPMCYIGKCLKKLKHAKHIFIWGFVIGSWYNRYDKTNYKLAVSYFNYDFCWFVNCTIIFATDLWILLSRALPINRITLSSNILRFNGQSLHRDPMSGAILMGKTTETCKSVVGSFVSNRLQQWDSYGSTLYILVNTLKHWLILLAITWQASGLI